MFLVLPVGTLGLLFGGGGGGGILLCFISRCFVSIVLVLVVNSIVSCLYMSGVLF